MTPDQQKEGGVLLLGASGRLGRMLQQFWPAPGDLICQSRQPLRGHLCLDPLLDPIGLRQAMRGRRAVLVMAGVTPARAGGDPALLDLNRQIALAVVEVAAQVGCGPVFLASSAAVYGNQQGLLGEDHPCQPLSAYGKSKLEMERAAQARADRLDHPLTALRIGNVAGADAMLGGWHRQMQLDQWPDHLTARRSYVGPVTLARMLYQLSRRGGLPPQLNLAARGSVALGDLLNAAGLTWKPRPALPGAIPEVLLDVTLLQRLLDSPPPQADPVALVVEWRRLRTRLVQQFG